MSIKLPIPGSTDLLDRIQETLTPNRLPLLFAIDGADGCSKSSLASWLAWQLGMPAVQLDLYLTSLTPVQWLMDDLARVVARRIDRRRPLIVDGVLALDPLEQISRKVDFLVFVTSEQRDNTLAAQIASYQSRQRISPRANFTIDGYRD